MTRRKTRGLNNICSGDDGSFFVVLVSVFRFLSVNQDWNQSSDSTKQLWTLYADSLSVSTLTKSLQCQFLSYFLNSNRILLCSSETQNLPVIIQVLWQKPAASSFAVFQCFFVPAGFSPVVFRSFWRDTAAAGKIRTNVEHGCQIDIIVVVVNQVIFGWLHSSLGFCVREKCCLFLEKSRGLWELKSCFISSSLLSIIRWFHKAVTASPDYFNTPPIATHSHTYNHLVLSISEKRKLNFLKLFSQTIRRIAILNLTFKYALQESIDLVK